MKKTILALSIFATGIIFYSCKSTPTSDDFSTTETTEPATATTTDSATTTASTAYDATKGEGKFSHIDIGAKLDAAMAASGEKVYEAKCTACHKLTDEKLVGPGWKSVTTRHTPEWIMNFITNTDVMLNKDPEAKKQLETCQVRMPNQSLTDEDARNVLEFMRKNDGVK